MPRPIGSSTILPLEKCSYSPIPRRHPPLMEAMQRNRPVLAMRESGAVSRACLRSGVADQSRYPRLLMARLGRSCRLYHRAGEAPLPSGSHSSMELEPNLQHHRKARLGGRKRLRHSIADCKGGALNQVIADQALCPMRCWGNSRHGTTWSNPHVPLRRRRSIKRVCGRRLHWLP